MKTSSTSFKSKYRPSSLFMRLLLDSFVSSLRFAASKFFGSGSQFDRGSVSFSVLSHCSVFLVYWGCSANCHSSKFHQLIDINQSTSFVTLSQFLYLPFLYPALPKTVTVSQ